ncbi:MAG: calcium-translocating P-type ATPase, PMCA-type [Firmicutes bacterium]|nr:calcium-translocating P-type ATPase, PMCA-type [Bacillota bacterium]
MQQYGLSDRQVEESRARHGSNQMTEQKRETFWQKLRQNFRDPMIRILCIALGINLIFAFMGETAWYEALGIAVAVLLAVLISTLSEHRNESAFQKLQEEADRILCKVYRNGSLEELPISEIVVGDVVLLQAGDKIPADGIMKRGSIKVDQSALNGEAEEVEKLPPDGDIPHMGENVDFLHPSKVFRGSVVCGGNGLMEVSVVGDASVYGRLAGELQLDEERESPLKVKLHKLAGAISRFGYMGGILIAVAFLFQRVVVHNGFDLTLIAAYAGNGVPLLADLLEAVMLAVIIIVMAVPEGLPLMIAIVSALNMGKMLSDGVLVRKVTGIETAGSLNILFSDKTGTITRGQLETVVFLDGAGHTYNRFREIGAGLQDLLALNIHYNSSAVQSRDADGNRIFVGGNATERAMLDFASRAPGHQVELLSSEPFNSTNKYSLATVSDGQEVMTLVKGAPERLLQFCTHYYTGEGARQPLTQTQISALDAQIDALAKRAIRVLVLAIAPEERETGCLPEGEWALLGIVGIRDEVRPEAKAAIAQVQRAGVQVVMITGDRKDTAIAIAKDSGVLSREDELTMTSDDLAEHSDEELKALLPRLRVVARALPSDKSRLVRLAQELNLVVGMTGDGVNDSPALKRADVGFAMGSGTEVAKEAGDIVILDDNFQSVAKAVLYGRTIFNSIRKFIIFQLTINVSAVLISFLAPLLGMESPLSITQILWINLVMDTLAALAFGGEPALDRYMEEPPKRRDEAILSSNVKGAILTSGLWTVAAGLFLLLAPIATEAFRAAPDDRYHMTAFFAFFIFNAIFNAFNARSEGLNLFAHMKKNPGFIRVIGIIVVVQIALTQLGGPIFRCFGLTFSEWAFVILLAFLIIPVDLLRKAIIAARQSDHRSIQTAARLGDGSASL